MTTQTTIPSIEEYFSKTGKRFRVSRKQAKRIQEGTLTREDAFLEWFSQDKLIKNPKVIPKLVYLDPELDLDNYSERVLALSGIKTRFRMNREQSARFANGQLTREDAFKEFVATQQKV